MFVAEGVQTPELLGKGRLARPLIPQTDQSTLPRRTGCISSNRIIRKHYLPKGRGIPLSGPLPFIATIPSAMTKWTGTVAQISSVLRHADGQL